MPSILRRILFSEVFFARAEPICRAARKFVLSIFFIEPAVVLVHRASAFAWSVMPSPITALICDCSAAICAWPVARLLYDLTSAVATSRIAVLITNIARTWPLHSSYGVFIVALTLAEVLSGFWSRFLRFLRLERAQMHRAAKDDHGGNGDRLPLFSDFLALLREPATSSVENQDRAWTLEGEARDGLCIICWEHEVNPKRMPLCEHLMCVGCLKRLNKHSEKHARCPYCRKPIFAVQDEEEEKEAERLLSHDPPVSS